MGGKTSIIAVVLLIVGLVAVATLLSENPNNNQTLTPSPRPEGNTQTDQSFQSVTIPLVSLGDQVNSEETFGCDDSIVLVTEQGDFMAETSVEAALTELFNTNQITTSADGVELYNSLANSDLVVDRVVDEGGTVTVYISGQMMLGGTCDNPRVEEQLTRTVEENSTVNEIEIFINDKTLQQALSLQ